MNIPIEARKCRSRSKEKEATPIIKKELNGKIENMKNKLKKEALKKIDLYRLNKQMKPLSIDLLKTSFLSNQQNTGNSEPNSKNSNKNNNNNLQFNLKCLKTVSVNLSEKNETLNSLNPATINYNPNSKEETPKNSSGYTTDHSSNNKAKGSLISLSEARNIKHSNKFMSETFDKNNTFSNFFFKLTERNKSSGKSKRNINIIIINLDKKNLGKECSFSGDFLTRNKSENHNKLNKLRTERKLLKLFENEENI